MDGEVVAALMEDVRGEMEKVGECKVVAFIELVAASVLEDVFGPGGSEVRSAADELVECNGDSCCGGLRLALRCGIGGGGLVFWYSSICDAIEKLLPDFGVAGGEGGRSGGNP